MPILPDSTQRRLDKLVDRQMLHSDAEYHHAVRFMQRWLDMTNMAMEDEGVNHTVRERVLNRVVYGAPDPNDAHQRIDMREQMRQMAMTAPPGKITQEWVDSLLDRNKEPKEPRLKKPDFGGLNNG